MARPTPYRLALGLLLRFYVVPRPIDADDEKGPFVEALNRCSDRLAHMDNDMVSIQGQAMGLNMMN
jgi:hypothetical protein